MKKILLAIIFSLLISTTTFAKVVPDNIQNFIQQDFPDTNFRFDGVILLPDNTMYLPLFPAEIIDVENVTIKSTYPINMQLKQKPDMVILNNNYVLLKVLNVNGKKTVINMQAPPQELLSGLLPQDVLLPKGLVIPESLKGIIGNVEVDVASENGLRINNIKKANNSISPVTNLANKVFYISTGANKNIQVLDANTKNPEYALKQEHVIRDIKAYNNEFLIVTYFDTNIVEIISLMDEKVIKQVPLKSTPDQIIINENEKTAYLTSGENSSIYVLNLETMTLKQQLKINGMCEKFTLSADGTKLFYVDRNTNNIWAIELDNKYMLKNIGSFPNISKIAYANGKIYIISRTKNRIAIVDYETLGFISEMEIGEKPVDLFVAGDNLYILSAQDNLVEIIDTKEDTITDKIALNTSAFATTFTPIKDSSLVMITNAMAGVYSVLDTDLNMIVKTSPIDVPVRVIVVTDKVKVIK